MLEQRPEREVKAGRLAHPGDEAHRQQRVPAEGEEPVVEADAGRAGQFGVERRQQGLFGIPRRAVAGFALDFRLGQGAAVELAVGRERQPLERDEGGGIMWSGRDCARCARSAEAGGGSIPPWGTQ